MLLIKTADATAEGNGGTRRADQGPASDVTTHLPSDATLTPTEPTNGRPPRRSAPDITSLTCHLAVLSVLSQRKWMTEETMFRDFLKPRGGVLSIVFENGDDVKLENGANLENVSDNLGFM